MLTANQHAQRFIDDLEALKAIAPIIGMAEVEDNEGAANRSLTMSLDELLKLHESVARVHNKLETFHSILHGLILMQALNEGHNLSDLMESLHDFLTNDE